MSTTPCLKCKGKYGPLSALERKNWGTHEFCRRLPDPITWTPGARSVHTPSKRGGRRGKR